MKVFRQTIILFVLFVLVVGGYFLFLKPAEKRKKEKEEREKKLIEYDSSKVSEIWIEKPDGQKVGFRKKDSKWDIIYPVWAEADRFSVDPIASRYSSVEIERLIEKNPKDLKEFGLDNPRFKVRIKLDDGKEFGIFIGLKSQVGYSVYAMREDDPEKRVVLVSGALESVIDKKFEDFRERRPMDFVVPDVRELTIEKGSQTYLFEKREEGGTTWYIKFPENTTFVKAKESEVRDLLYKINGIKVVSFVSDTTEPQFDFGEPDIIIRALTQGGEKFELLLKLKDKQIYAKRPDRPNIFTVEVGGDFYNTLFASKYRERKVISYYVWRVKEIAIERKDKSTIIQRDRENVEKWYLLGKDQKKELDSSKVKELLSQLSNVEVVDFVEDNVKDITKYIPEEKVRIKIEVEGKAIPYYLVLGEEKNIKGTKGILGALQDQNAVYIFPPSITNIISQIENLAGT